MQLSKYIQYSIILLLRQMSNAQETAHNFGAIQIHNSDMIDFHLDLINTGTFDQNLGLAGFYHSKESLSILGALSPTFYDFETAMERDLNLEVPLMIDNLIYSNYGNIKSSRNNKNICTRVSENAPYEGAVNIVNNDGLAAVEEQRIFSNNPKKSYRVEF